MKNMDVFREEFNKTAESLSLNDWDVKIVEQAMKSDDANIEAFAAERVAKITLSKSCPPERIRLVARHEAWHLFLANYRALAHSRYVEGRELEQEEERLCTIGEKICF